MVRRFCLAYGQLVADAMLEADQWSQMVKAAYTVIACFYMTFEQRLRV
jgi:hypothetical protein